MTTEKLNNIIHKCKIPSKTTIISDSGWDCNPIDMDEIYYGQKERLLILRKALLMNSI